MTLFYSTFSTPLGPFSVAVNKNQSIVATAFGKLPSLKLRLGKCHLISDIQKCAQAHSQVIEYFTGKHAAFSLELEPSGTEFQHAVWHALTQIPRRRAPREPRLVLRQTV